MSLPDLRTLTLAMMLVTVIFGLVMVAVGAVHRRYPGPRHWAAAGVMFALVCLVLVAREQVGLFTTVLVGNGFALAGISILSHGIHRFLGRPSPLWFYFLVSSMAVLPVMYFAIFLPDLGARMVIYSLGMGILLLHAGWVLLGRLGSGSAIAYRLNGSALILGGGLHVLRGAYFLFNPGPAAYYSPNLVNVLFQLSLIMLYCALMPGLVLMLSSRLADDLKAHVADLRDEIGMRRQAEERLALEAALDPLTGLYNRRKFFSEAARAFSLAHRHGRPLSVMILDLDHFKDVNDTHGHETGDRVLRALARHCQDQMRAEDILARFGGEEFVALLPDTDREGALVMAERLRRSLGETEVRGEKGPVRVTASFGVSQLMPGETNLNFILRRADQALYQAKQAGRDQVRVSPEEPDGTEPQ